MCKPIHIIKTTRNKILLFYIPSPGYRRFIHMFRHSSALPTPLRSVSGVSVLLKPGSVIGTVSSKMHVLSASETRSRAYNGAVCLKGTKPLLMCWLSLLTGTSHFPSYQHFKTCSVFKRFTSDLTEKQSPFNSAFKKLISCLCPRISETKACISLLISWLTLSSCEHMFNNHVELNAMSEKRRKNDILAQRAHTNSRALIQCHLSELDLTREINFRLIRYSQTTNITFWLCICTY